MKVNFKQGIVSAPTNFLTLNADKVNLTIPINESVILNIADGISNYLVTERAAITNAWTGPFVPGTDYWLYWDFNVITGARTFGFTTQEPVEGAVAPAANIRFSNQTTHQVTHWFDTNKNQMFIWAGSRWVRRVRIFAAKLQAGAIFISVSKNSPSFLGTQIGSLEVPVISGALLYDTNGLPIKKGNGQFFTTEDAALSGILSSTQVKFGSILIQASAARTMTAYTLVRFIDFNEVDMVTNSLVDNSAYGIIEQSVNINESVNVVTDGVVENPLWDWSALGINAPLYSDVNGQLTSVPSSTNVIVAGVIDKNKILLRPSSLFLSSDNEAATINDVGTVRLSNPPLPGDINAPIVISSTDARINAINPHIANNNVHLTSVQNNFLDTVEGLTSGGILSVEGGTTYVARVRTLTAPATGMTITNGTGVAGNPTFAFANDLAAVEGLSTNGFAVRTTDDNWVTRSITGTTNRLTITNGDGILGNTTVDIATSYVGQSSITTLGTITTGTWEGTTIAPNKGGTGLTSALTGQAGNSIRINIAETGYEFFTPNTGTVSTVSVASSNGFAGTVATATSTPVLTISTSVIGVLKGNGTSLSAAVVGTDYSAGTSALGTGIVKTTTTSGTLSVAVAADFPVLNQNTTGTAANVTGTVAVANGGTGATSASAALTALLPSQSGQAGKVLKTNATVASWEELIDPIAALSSGPTTTWNVGVSKTANVTLTQNSTLALTGTLISGAVMILKIVQDGTGGFTFTFPANVKFAGGVAPTISTAPTAVDIFTFLTDGTDLYEMSRAVDVN